MSEHEHERRALVVEHQPDAPAGYIGERAEYHGYRLEVVRAAPGAFPDPAGYDLVITLGSGEAAYDDTVPFLADELDLLHRADDAGVPVLGICFGAQALARALGGHVRPGDGPEIGWTEVDTDIPELVPPGPWLVWHFDVFTPPVHATELARTPVGSQAFVHGPHLGVQFHPEATPSSVDNWARTYEGAIKELGNDPDEIRAETERTRDAARWRAHDLFDRFHRRVHGD